MEIKNYSSQQIDKLLNVLIDNARSTTNGRGNGEKSKPTAREDGVDINNINGVSIQYSVEYRNYIVYLFKRGAATSNKGYLYKVADKDLQVWFSLVYNIQKKYTIDLDDLDNLELDIDEDVSKESIDITKLDTNYGVKVMPPKPDIF